MLDGFTGFTPIQNKLMKKLMEYAKKVTVTVTIDSREDPYRMTGEHQLFYLSQKTVSTLSGLGSGGSYRGAGYRASLGTVPV